jgi:alpha-mannosidase
MLVFVENIPAYGFKKVLVKNGPDKTAAGFFKKLININAPEKTASSIRIAENHLENRFFSVDLNENGEITSFIDKENGRQICCGKPMNVLCAFEDKPLRFDAWDIDIFYREKPYGPMKLISAEVIETGPVRGALRLTWKFNESVIQQDMVIYDDKDRIDFKTYVSWKEEQVLLKAFFPVDVHSNEATYEIQYGNIQRPTHTNTEWDFAKFEVPGHKWADLSEGNYGVSLLNDCKYGYDIHKNVIGITLIKSAINPDETADRCDHYFTYSLYPHNGSWKESDVQKSAMELNMPLLGKEAVRNSGSNDSFGLLQVDSDHIVIDTVKRAEDERAYIVRLYEYKNCKEKSAELVFGIPVKKAVETDLLEQEQKEVEVKNNRISFDISGYEIKTFKLYF